MKRLRRWLLSLIDRTIAELRAELREADQRDIGRVRELAAVTETCRRATAGWSREQKLLDAVLEAIDFANADAAWRQSPEAAFEALAAHLGTIVQPLQERASRAERDAEDLRAALADERHEHDKTRKILEASDVQNKQLSEIIERDRARVAAETANYNRRKAQAETDARRQPEEET